MNLETPQKVVRKCNLVLSRPFPIQFTGELEVRAIADTVKVVTLGAVKASTRRREVIVAISVPDGASCKELHICIGVLENKNMRMASLCDSSWAGRSFSTEGNR